MITKIAIREPLVFIDETEGYEYLYSFCLLCYDGDCDRNCIEIPAGVEECPDCTGAGRLRFTVSLTNTPPYNLITICGMCDGVGLV